MVTEFKLDKQKSSGRSNYRICAGEALLSDFVDLLEIFVHYVKARTPPVFCFPIATILSFLLISKVHMFNDLYIGCSIGIASYFLGLATYVYNDLTDIDVDAINRKEQSTIMQNQSRSRLIILVIFLFGLSASISFVVSYYALIISLIFIGLGIIYSHPRFNLKSKFPLKTIVTATGAGLLSLLGGVAAIGNGSNNNNIHLGHGLGLPLSTIYLSFSFAMFYFIQSPLGDIADIKGDRAAGRRTFPLVLGMNRTLAIMLSVPFIALAMNSLCYNLVHISVLGTVAIVSTCLLVVGFIGWISNRLYDPLFIKSKRNNVRYLNILMQVSLLIALM
jgi:geranylgeranylglycerol-phosphate geranylgeranyltransferase